MALDPKQNLAYSTVTGAPAPATTGTSVTLTSATNFPDPATFGPYPVTIGPVGTDEDATNTEVVYVTAKAGNVLTIVRAQEGSTARTVVVGDIVFFSLSAQSFNGAAQVGNRNRLINGGFNFFQRQAPATPTAVANDVYGPDRWNVLTQTAAVNVERQAATAGFKSYWNARLTQNQAAAQRMGIEQIIEGVNSYPLRGENVRFDFRAAASTTLTLRYAILEWTGAIDAVTSNVVLSWTSGVFTAGNFFLAASLTVSAVGSLSIVGAAAPVLCSLRAKLSASCNNAIVFIWTDAAAAQNVTVSISDAQLVPDSISQPFVPRATAEELLDCQRFYRKSFNLDTAPAQNIGAFAPSLIWMAGIVGVVAGVRPWETFNPMMRAAPAITLYNPLAANAQVRNASTGADCSASGAYQSSQVGTAVSYTGDAGSTAANILTVHYSADAEL